MTQPDPTPLDLEGVQMCVAIAVLTGNITASRGAEILGIRRRDMRELAQKWGKELDIDLKKE